MGKDFLVGIGTGLTFGVVLYYGLKAAGIDVFKRPTKEAKSEFIGTNPNVQVVYAIPQDVNSFDTSDMSVVPDDLDFAG